MSGLTATGSLANPRRRDGGSGDPAARLSFPPDHDPLNHRIFRFPARFHPPVARELIKRYVKPGGVVCDPFSGSGTVAVEALLAGCRAVATDIDPLSVLVTRAKTREYDLDELDRVAVRLQADLAAMGGADERIWGGFEREIPEASFSAAVEAVSRHVPALPNITHWFRRRVVIQLAAIRALVEALVGSPAHPLVELCFASIIRNASNADPVPVSGLEVTRHMLAKEALGRTIDPYRLLETSIRKAVEATRRFQGRRMGGGSARVSRADARHLSIRGTGPVDCVLTSPPYLAAVDYYRRHTLEMYWLGLTNGPEERARLIPTYLGRDRVGARHLLDLAESRGSAIAERWLGSMPAMRPEKERAFRHYCAGMGEAMSRMHDMANPGAPVIVVVGDVRLSGRKVAMSDLLEDLSPPGLVLSDRLWYPLANRFMTYERRNGADIDVDHVLVFKVKE